METLVGTSLARGGLRSWLEEIWFGIRLLFIVVVLEAVHLSLISLAVGLISHDEQSADGLLAITGSHLNAYSGYKDVQRPGKDLLGLVIEDPISQEITDIF
jgi:hypothetical protein